MQSVDYNHQLQFTIHNHFYFYLIYVDTIHQRKGFIPINCWWGTVQSTDKLGVEAYTYDNNVAILVKANSYYHSYSMPTFSKHNVDNTIYVYCSLNFHNKPTINIQYTHTQTHII